MEGPIAGFGRFRISPGLPDQLQHQHSSTETCEAWDRNNCYEDYAQRNGAELARLLEETW